MNKKKRRVTAKDLLYARLLVATDDPRELSRVLRRIGTMTKRNPTPLLKDLETEAWRLVRREGKRDAYYMALAHAYEAKDTREARRWRLLARMVRKVKTRKKVQGKTYYDKLIDEYGTTDAQGVRGFIVSDGSCLNLGQYDDHRIIVGVYRNSAQAEKKYGSRYGAFKALCKKYNMIRWIPESKMAEIFVPTTRDQDRTLMDLADAGLLRDVEVHRPRGGTVMLEGEDGETLVRGINAILG